MVLNRTRTALAFVVAMGVVSLFSDMTHQGASSILGDYLSLAGASATAIGFIAGLGELLGYGLRLLSGRWTDVTRKYWTFTIMGYLIDVAAVPALALVPRGGWIAASVLIVTERIGKAVKKPAKDTLVSFASAQMGRGKTFAIAEALDQLGAFLGPALLFLVLIAKRASDPFTGYRLCFALLSLPALATIISLLIARRIFPSPEDFEKAHEHTSESSEHTEAVSGAFRWYMAGISLFAFGWIDFPLITMHMARTHALSVDVLPLAYAGAMAIDALGALAFGWLYDRWGFVSLAVATAVAAPFAWFVFTDGHCALVIGIALWGLGMGAHESILKSAVSDLAPLKSRSTAFGVFQTFYGISWFLGSWMLGALYAAHRPLLIGLSLTCELAATALFLIAARKLPARGYEH